MGLSSGYLYILEQHDFRIERSCSLCPDHTPFNKTVKLPAGIVLDQGDALYSIYMKRPPVQGKVSRAEPKALQQVPPIREDASRRCR